MADPNPQATGGFEYWITDRITFLQVRQQSGDTGDFEKWLTDRIYWEDYLRGGRVPRFGFILYNDPGLV